MTFCCSIVIKPGVRVQVLYPAYAVGKTGVILEEETLDDGSKTGYWLVKIDGEDLILALMPREMRVL
ncbi:MAG: hypothetical protein AAF579_19695 [Cyanobacteria bacterium P01_C01_bin.118]